MWYIKSMRASEINGLYNPYNDFTWLKFDFNYTYKMNYNYELPVETCMQWIESVLGNFFYSTVIKNVMCIANDL